MAAKHSGSLDKDLQKALSDELKEVTRKETGDDGKQKFVYSLLDRNRVYDRALKMQAIKAKMTDESLGSEFGKT